MPRQQSKTKIKISPAAAYGALAMATMALMLNFWAWSLLSPLGASLAAEMALSPVRLSLLLAVPVIIGSLGRIIFGWLTDVYGGKTMFAVISILTALPVLGLIMAHGYSQFVLAAIFLGLGGTAFVIGVPFVSAWFPPERRGFVLGVYSMGNAGTALSGFATPRLTDSFGRNMTFVIVATLLTLVAIIFALKGRNAPTWKPAGGSPLNRLATAAKLRLTWDMASIYAVTFGAFVAFGVYLPLLLKVSYGLSLTDAASRAAGFVLLATAARPLGGWLSDRIGAKRVIRFSLGAIVPLAGFVAFQPTLQIHTTIAYLSLAFILGCTNGAVFALVGRRAKPEAMGSVTGLIGAAGGLGGFLPPLLLGFTYQRTQSYAFALVLLAFAALTVLTYINRRFKDLSVYG